jgi:hypothetical protein
VTPVEDIVAHDDEAREDNGISPAEMMLSHSFVQWTFECSFAKELHRAEDKQTFSVRPETIVESSLKK